MTRIAADADSHLTPARTSYWARVLDSAAIVPADRPLDEMTVELVEMLGEPDPYPREELAGQILMTWITNGVYDDLLPGVGDGMCEGLTIGIGTDGTDTIFRRSYSAVILTAVLARDNKIHSVHPATVLRWGDQGLGWLVRERDLRGFVTGKGWANAVAHGAGFVGALARSRHLDEGGLMVILDAVADRLLAPTPYSLTQGEDDRLAHATMALLHRNVVDMALLGPWVERIAALWKADADGPRAPQVGNAIGFVRALHAQLLLGVEVAGLDPDVAVRVELLGALQQALRTVGPWYRPSTPLA